ncbi:STAS domain-containing protein [Singulisphaera sp. PoT]|uniref:STAS domain-containing protein n=1 Tax=Singulisphaera sp. PoT TaxID=3411797 RepID=UPI003BF56FC1
MLKPAVQVHNINGLMVAEFWDCYRLDPTPVQDLRRLYEAHINVAGNKVDLVIDLLGIGFAGSAALGNFVALHRLARQRGGHLIFCNVDPTVQEVFRVSKLESLFAFVPDREAGLALVERGLGPAPADPAAPIAPISAPVKKNTGGGGLLRSSRRRKLS